MTHHLAHNTLDQAGLDTLNVISDAGAFNKWMYETIKPFCKGRIFEAGSGIGNISQYFLEDHFDITLSDESLEYCNFLSKKFSRYKNLTKVLKVDLVDPDFEQKHKDDLGMYDCVFALNVVEHIKDDLLAIGNCTKLLKKGGVLIILVPASMMLYNKFDKELGHFRRYSREMLKGLFLANHLSILDLRHFNFFGMPGWFFSGMLPGAKTIPEVQMKLFDKLVPLAKIADKIMMNQAGLSVISIGQKL